MLEQGKLPCLSLLTRAWLTWSGVACLSLHLTLMPIHFVEDEAAQEEAAHEEELPQEEVAVQEHLAGVAWKREPREPLLRRVRTSQGVARCRKVPGSITGVGLGCIEVPAMLQLLIRCHNKPSSPFSRRLCRIGMWMRRFVTEWLWSKVMWLESPFNVACTRLVDLSQRRSRQAACSCVMS